MQSVLVLDTSGAGLSMGLSLPDGRLLKCRRSRAQRQDQQLWPSLEDLLRRSGLKLQDLGGLAAVRGPGRFTGVRIGLAFSVVLGRCLGRPAVGLTGLEILAFEAAPGVAPGGRLLALISAERDEIFWQLFSFDQGRPRPDGEPRWSSFAELPKPDSSAALFLAGAPAEKASAAMAGSRVVVAQGPSLKALAALARQRLAALPKGSAGSDLVPLYLKPAKYELLGLGK